MAQKGKFADPEWFTPSQYQDARQYYWQKLETDKNLVLKEIPEEQRITYFNRAVKSERSCQYDLLYNRKPGWDQMSKRCDRQDPRIVENKIYLEERERIVPVLYSSIYGHRKTNLEGKPIVYHQRTNHIQEFYRRNNVNLKPSRGLPKDPSVEL